MGTEFSVEGQRVTVGGAARSGVAAAELLAAKGALVTVSEARSSVPERDHLESLGIRVAAGGNDPALFRSADLIVLSPGVPVESAVSGRRRDEPASRSSASSSSRRAGCADA